MSDSDCVLCAGSELDSVLMVEEVWSNDLWRLTTVTVGEVAGYSYLSPRRHIRHVTDLDGEEAATFGEVLAKASHAIQKATGAELVFSYIFGTGLDHFHVHLAPHREPNSPLTHDSIKGAKHLQHLASGQEVWVSDRYPLQDPDVIAATINDIAIALGTRSEPVDET